MKFDDNVDEWVKVLKKRFKKSFFDALNTIIIFKYTFDDARRRRDLVDYVLALFKAVKIIDVSIYSQLYFIYNNLKSEFRRDLTRFTFDIIMNQFFKQMKNNKKIWWDIVVSRNRNHVSFDYFVNRSVNISNNFRFADQQNSYNSDYRFSNFSNNNEGFSLKDYGFDFEYSAVGSQNTASRQTQYSTSYQFNNQNRTYQNQQSNQPQYSKPSSIEVGQLYEKKSLTQQY